MSSFVAGRSSQTALPVPYSFKRFVTSPEQLRYSLGSTIGSGTYAKVKAAWSPYERKMIAIKMLDKGRASRDVLYKFLPREVEVVRRLDHPGILRVFAVVETQRELYFMMEMAENGDLLDYINWRRHLPESEARYVLRGAAAGVSHCHSKNIVHRDLKCENIMITRDMRIKIGDFGFARSVGAGESPVSTPCGSYSYAAPELLCGGPESTYDGKKVDIWSLGCVLYAMVCGCLPFGDDATVTQMINRPLTFSKPISPDCKHVLRSGMLRADSEKRYDITRLRLSPWMRALAQPLTPYPSTKIQSQDVLPQSLPNWETPSCSDRLRPSSVPVSVSKFPAPVSAAQIDSKKKNEEKQLTTVSVGKRNKKEKMKSKMCSASKKLVHTILQKPSSSSSRTSHPPFESAV